MLSLLLLALASPVRAAPTVDPADVIVGRWRCEGDDMLIEIVKLGKIYVGTVVLYPRNTTLNGKRLLRNLSYEPTHATWRGEVFMLPTGKYGPATLRAKTVDILAVTGLFGSPRQETLLKRASS